MNVLPSALRQAGDVVNEWRSEAFTHVGKVRTLNEDRFLDMPEHGLWVIADGMGGHDAGDISATATVRALAAVAENAKLLTMKAITNALQCVNLEIHTDMKSRGQFGGCTVAGLLMSQCEAHVFWAGDSRVYRFGEGHLKQLTRDHSVVQDMIDMELIQADQAARHPQANVITRAVGVADHLDLETLCVPRTAEEEFFLCSDGITNEVSTSDISKALKLPHSKALAEIMKLALAAGARDNMTAINVSCRT